MMTILTFELGPVQTNTYLVADPQCAEAVVIDPAWEGERIVAEARRRGWKITAVWATHAHFDHIGGVGGLVKGCQLPPTIALHPADRSLWDMQGGAALFGLRIDPAPPPTIELTHGQTLPLGEYTFEVRCLPGHTPGHVIFYCARETVAFCGDAVFQGSIGRTDLPGGDYEALIQNIQEQILSLPDDTRLLCGHGPETTVGLERVYNPYLA